MRVSVLLSGRVMWAETPCARGRAQRLSPSPLSSIPPLSLSLVFSFQVSFVSFFFILLVKGSGPKNHLSTADRNM